MRNIGLGFIVICVVGCGAAAENKSASSPTDDARSARSGSEESTGGVVAASAAPAGYPEMAAQPGYAAASPPPPSSPSTPSAVSPSESSVAPSASAKDATPLAVAPPPARAARALPQAGQLTAGVWDDNANFDFFKPYASTFAKNRGSDFAMFAEQELTTARDAGRGVQTPRAELDVQLVLDTTGSMGDELAYLQGEFDAIASTVRTKFPNVTPRWSLVVYRDHGDAYLTRQFDFTTDTARFRKDLRAQSAAGGGDTPEAVVEGLTAGLHQGWRAQNDNVAKIAFWVADAPAHPGEGHALAGAIREAKKKGVHIYPIASSDTDDAAEYQMRSAAQLTGGRYVFLTNDSGIGNDHAEPHIPCYNVTRLDSAIVRMIQVELTGRHAAPEENEVVRSVGRPNKEGKCTLASGMLVASY